MPTINYEIVLQLFKCVRILMYTIVFAMRLQKRRYYYGSIKQYLRILKDFILHVGAC